MSELTGLVYPLPWQMNAWQKLVDLHAVGKLPHALLLSGTDGSGVNRLALAFAQYVMCANPGASGACGNCSSCGLTIASTHPDFKLLAPEKTGGQIKVDSVRSVVKFGHNTAQQGGYRVVVVAPAESMNTFSANSLLKSLEEPGEKTLFILISHMPAALLATIKSRCQWIKLPEPTREQGMRWLTSVMSSDVNVDELLDLTNDQPIKALNYYSGGELEQIQKIKIGLDQLAAGRNSALALAAAWARWPAMLVVDGIYYWSVNWMKSSILNQTGNARARQGMQKLVEQILQRRRNLLAGNNPNVQLLLEALMLDLSKALTIARG
jgi:DNA polymerase-3 subunit delta'